VIAQLWVDVGMNKPRFENQGYSRGEIMHCHGLRKFFETNAFKAGMDHIYIRRLLGQKSGLEDSYLKIPARDLLEGDSMHIGYLGIIDQLTINNENRLKRENIILKNEVGEIRQALDELEKVKKHLGLS
jgi:hypothetical protein